MNTIVLDLDETLIHSFSDIEDLYKINLLDPQNINIRSNYYILDFLEETNNTQYHIWGIKRPHLINFLLFCRKIFKLVIVWTAGTSDYVKNVVDTTFPYKPDYIFSRKHCSKIQEVYTKPLHKLFIMEPKLNTLTNINSIIMVDDLVENVKFNKNRSILVDSFEPNINDIKYPIDDEVLIMLVDIIIDIILGVNVKLPIKISNK